MFLVLPSNSSHEFFPNNTLANFTTRLPHEIDLSDGYEVGLTEVQYTHNWFSFTREDHVSFAYKDPRLHSKEGWHEIFILPGYYHDKGEFMKVFNYNLDTHLHKRGKATWDKTSNIVTIEVYRDVILKLSPTLKKFLDFPEGQVEMHKGQWHSGTEGILNNKITALYVYCDIVRPRVVGDSRVSLLRPVPVTGDHGKNVFFSFTNVHYLPINTNIFQTVEIDIRDDTGQPVPFRSGRVVITLHLRRRQPFA
jgi:hypothetical protein